MTIQINQKIIKYAVNKDTKINQLNNNQNNKNPEPLNNSIVMHESIKRPEILLGSTYKIQTPLSEHALYVTINDIILNENTTNEQRHPFEIFVNSKNMENFQWIVALTRVISALFRKGGDINFITEELQSVFDPKGGYFKRGGKYMPSLVAELGEVIKTHLEKIGIKNKNNFTNNSQENMDNIINENLIANGSLCNKCNSNSVIKNNGCTICFNCGESKCE